jgi:hypothetical protein
MEGAETGFTTERAEKTETLYFSDISADSVVKIVCFLDRLRYLSAQGERAEAMEGRRFSPQREQKQQRFMFLCYLR